MRKSMMSSIAFGLALLTASSAFAQLAEKKVITLAAARKMMAAAEAEAERNHWAAVIAVVDDGGSPIVIERMDHAAVVAGVELAPGKARAAALFKKPSGDLEDAINGGRIAATTARGFVEMQGALPITVDGDVIGAIGVSTDTKDHDVQIARAGVAALKR
jgi:glc operon protein GlcG